MITGKYELARERYRPHTPKIILIAESPPKSSSRFFYYEKVSKHDHLFLNVMKALYPKMSNYYDRSPDAKRELLWRFQRDGFFLLDAVDEPLGGMTDKERAHSIIKNWPTLMQRLSGFSKFNPTVILIKKVVFDTLAEKIAQLPMNIVNDKHIPFPSSGRQKEFAAGFRSALRAAGWDWK